MIGPVYARISHGGRDRGELLRRRLDHLDLVIGGGVVDGDRVFGSLAGPGTVEEIVVRERSADQARVVVADVVAVPRRVLTVRL